MKKIHLIWVIPLSVIFAALAMIGVLMELKVIPDTEVVKEAELNERMLDAIGRHLTLGPGEDIRYFYAFGLWTFDEAGVIITNQRVMVFGDLEASDTFEVFGASYDEMVAIEQTGEGSFVDDATYLITTTGEYHFQIVLSVDNDRHVEAVAYIQDMIEAARR